MFQPTFFRQHVNGKNNLTFGELSLFLIPCIDTGDNIINGLNLFILYHPMHCRQKLKTEG